jgi:predicted PurR-regulated permease PerM
MHGAAGARSGSSGDSRIFSPAGRTALDSGMSPERREIVFSRGMRALFWVVVVGFAFYWLRSVLTPIFLAFTIAYILDPLVDRLEAFKVPRPAGIALVLGFSLALFALLLTLVLPSIGADLATVAKELPAYVETAFTNIGAWLTRRGVEVPHSSSEWIERFGAELQTAAGTVVGAASGVVGWAIGSTASMVGSLAAALVVPVLAVYFLNDFDRIVARIKELLPARHRELVTGYAREIDQVLSQFLRGQLTVMLVLAFLYGAAYAALGVRLAVPIGIAAGMLNIIPYLGSAFALSAGILMSLLGGWNPAQLAGVVLAYAVVQSLEGFVITPRIVGKTVGLQEGWVLLALFVGGEIFGFLGVLLAVPVAAVAKIFVLRGLEAYRASTLYHAD